jgi:hypothetical protein
MKALTLFLAVGTIFYFALDTTFQDMTRHDCEANKIQLACEDLKK